MAVLGADAGEDALGTAHPFEIHAGALGVREEVRFVDEVRGGRLTFAEMS